MHASAPGPRHRRASRWIVLLPIWTVMLGAAALLVLGVAVPRLAGATPYVILTDSMRPTLPAGTVVISRPVDPEDVGVGDVITYQLRSGEPEVVTHRVVTVSFTVGGEYVFTTRGDANDLPDALPVRAVQLRGKSWYAIPYLGRVTSLVDNDDRRVLSWSIGVVLVGYGVICLAGALLDRRRRQGPPDLDPTDVDPTDVDPTDLEVPEPDDVVPGLRPVALAGATAEAS